MPTEDYMSNKWLKSNDRKATRIEFDGPKWNWPVNKLVNESPIKLVKNESITRGMA